MPDIVAASADPALRAMSRPLCSVFQALLVIVAGGWVAAVAGLFAPWAVLRLMEECCPWAPVERDPQCLSYCIWFVKELLFLE